ncbi:MAG: hypothetical protein QOF60_3361 [Actinomycetota bacterium]|nr:hypothetical protein [Actinomycetota bacterium]
MVFLVAFGGSVASAQEAPAPPSDAGLRERLFELVSSERAAAGLQPLAWSDDLVVVADEHSARMAEAHDIFHNDGLFTVAAKARMRARVVGENVAMNASIDDAHRRLMLSDGHRHNILDGSFDRLGLGLAYSGTSWFVTEVFVQTRAAAAPAPAPVAAPVAAPAPVVAPPAAPRAAPAPTAPPTTTPLSATDAGQAEQTWPKAAVEEPEAVTLASVPLASLRATDPPSGLSLLPVAATLAVAGVGLALGRRVALQVNTVLSESIGDGHDPRRR